MDEALGHFIAGYISGEGSFYISQPKSTLGQMQCGFTLKVHADDQELVEAVWLALGKAGRIYPPDVKRAATVTLMIRSQNELVNAVIPFFDQYPLRGKKRDHYDLWKQAVLMMWNNEHLTRAGWEAIAALKTRMNRS